MNAIVIILLSALSAARVGATGWSTTDCDSLPQNLLSLEKAEDELNSWAPGDTVVVEGFVSSIHSPHKLVIAVRVCT